MRAADVLDGLDAAQAHAVRTESAPLCILAGPGSGKTRVLTRRIAYRVATGDADARHVLALTFTRRAAGELSERLHRLGLRDHVAAGTFHAVAHAQLRQWYVDRGNTPPALLDRKAKVLVRLLGERNGTLGAAEVAGEIEWAKARLVTPDGYAAAARDAGRRLGAPPEVVADLYAAYEEAKRRRRLVDFDDLLGLLARALRGDRAFAERQRWRFRHLFVDEFQDVNPLQFELLEAWRGGRPDVCVVGDPDQAVYAWNGADPGLLASFPERVGGAEVVRLDVNYRSSPRVVALARAVLADPDDRPALLPRSPGPPPTLRAYPDAAAEAVGIARVLRRRRGRRPWRDLAVIVRTHAQLDLIGDALRAAGIPFRVKGSGPLAAQAAVADTLDRLRRRPSAPLVGLLPDLEAAAAETEASGVVALVRLAREQIAVDPTTTAGTFATFARQALTNDVVPEDADAVELATFHAAKGLEWAVVCIAGLEDGLVPVVHARSDAALAEERRLLYVAVTRARDEVHLSWAQQRPRASDGAPSPRSPSPWLPALRQVLRAAGASEPDPASFLDGLAASRRALEHAEPPESSSGPLGDPDRAEDPTEPTAPAGTHPGQARLTLVGAPRPDAERRPRRSRTPAAAPVGDPEVRAARAALEAWRAATARAAAATPPGVLTDAALEAVAEARPTTVEDLAAVPGVGPLRAARHGPGLLAALATATLDGTGGAQGQPARP